MTVVDDSSTTVFVYGKLIMRKASNGKEYLMCSLFFYVKNRNLKQDVLIFIPESIGEL